MSGRHLVIVESPAKAKTINKYLGDDFTVLASYGHVRDLPPKDGSVRPEDDFAMDWEVAGRAKKHIDEIVKAAKDADAIYLATDPDREGEAISWHVQEVLKGKRGLGKTPFHRVTFNEITKQAVLDAIEHPRTVNDELVEAYLARRALDYLVGFTLSPVLWRKLPGSKSAGRVQSVALRLICDREAEIENFVPREYWSVAATFATDKGETLSAQLTHLDGTKLKQFDLADEAAAKRAAAAVEAGQFSVRSVEHKQVTRNPAPPFTTSTLQQEASRKLGFSATQTMRTAQRLYEGVEIGGETVGLITYMRTDGTQLAGEAIAGLRTVIGQDYGDRYLPDSPRTYRSKAKNAQEAHEAIRPTDPRRTPDQMSRYLNEAERKLYQLIWKRTVACQMAPAKLDQVGIDIADRAGKTVLRATGSVILFDGFLKLYVEGRDDGAEDGEDKRLPAVEEGQGLERRAIEPKQHFTQPPPRFTEASLVKKLEELGIGRPSTYASILQVLQDREYVRLEGRRFVAEDRGRLVTTFLASFFERYVEYDFTAKLEEQLDDISGGRIDWKTVLRDFWRAFSEAVEETRDLTISQVIDALDAELGPHFFRDPGDGSDPRRCPSCGDGRLGLKLSRNGAFIGCSNYPDCRYTRPLAVPTGEEAEEANTFPRDLGHDPETGLPVSIRKGPYGFYAQLGPADDADKGEKPKRVSLTKDYDPATIDQATALALLALPRTVGTHPESGKPIEAGIGRYGPYLRHDGAYTSLKADDDVLQVGMNRAMDLLANAKQRGGGSTPERELGTPPGGGAPVAIYKGRYGPYVRQGKGKTMASLPKGRDIDDITLEEAVALLEAKKSGGAGGRKAAATSGKNTNRKQAGSGKNRKAAGTKSKQAKGGTKE